MPLVAYGVVVLVLFRHISRYGNFPIYIRVLLEVWGELSSNKDLLPNIPCMVHTFLFSMLDYVHVDSSTLGYFCNSICLWWVSPL